MYARAGSPAVGLLALVLVLSGCGDGRDKPGLAGGMRGGGDAGAGSSGAGGAVGGGAAGAGSDAGPPTTTGTGGSTPPGGLSCLQIFACIDQCPDAEKSCPGACETKGTADGQAAFSALIACAIEEDCADSDCFTARCGPQTAACGGPGGGGGGAGRGSGGMGGPAGIAGGGTFPDFANGSNGDFPQLVIDPAGVRHFIYGTISASVNTVRYGQCSADCGRQSSWRFVSIGNRGTWGGKAAKLAVTPQGGPRITWPWQGDSNDPVIIYLSACDSNCTDAAGWTSGPIEDLTSNGTLWDRTGTNLAIDGSGRLHFIYNTNGGIWYTTCAGGCTSAASWSAKVNVTSADPSYTGLAVSASGQVRVAFGNRSTSVLTYRTCESGCDNVASWAPEVPLFYNNEGRVALRLDAAGRPRILYNQGGVGKPNDHVTFFASCDTGCQAPAGWVAFTVGFAAGAAERGLDLEIDAAGNPVAVVESATDLVAQRCTDNCRTASATWVRTTVESSQASPAPNPPQCGTDPRDLPPISVWVFGDQVATAFNPVTGQVEAAHIASNLRRCGPTGVVMSDSVRIARYWGGF
jgi:hypothetical protein